MPYWEDIKEGMSLPPLQKQPTTQMLVMYCAAHPVTSTRFTTTPSSPRAWDCPAL